MKKLIGVGLVLTAIVLSVAIAASVSYQMSVSFNLCPSSVFDTREGTYPSISGTHNGTINPTTTITVSKLYMYPCSGTGGHTEYTRIWNKTWEVDAYWNGYTGDWHTILFNESFTLIKGQTYNYTIVTGSYPQMHHTNNLLTPAGFITCTEFMDVNGRLYNDWIPAIRLGG